MRLIYLAAVAGSFAHSAYGAIVNIPDGDCNALANAVASAESRTDQTTVLLARSGHYAGCGFTMNDGNVTIDGRGSHIAFLRACLPAADAAPPFSDANLTLRNMTIGGASENSAGFCPSGGFKFISTVVGISNFGSITFDSVALEDLTTPQSFYDGYIQNAGSLVFRNVTIANVHQHLAAPATGVGAIVNNTGHVEIYGSTFVGNSTAVLGNTSAIPLIDSESYDGEIASVKISNSLMTENANPICGSIGNSHLASYTSLGGNFASETSCGFSAAKGDRIETDAALGDYANHGGLVPTQALSMTSRARIIGIPQYCEAVDARGQTRNPDRCDAGAYEFGGGQAQLTQGGMSGVFYNHTYNGHYVSIERLDTGNALVFWNTFDQHGNPAWVYGVATVTSTHLHTDASQNLGAVLQPGSAPLGYHAQPWGSIDIDLTDCNNGTFAYHTALPQFGSGQFALTRLTNVAGLQCTMQ